MLKDKHSRSGLDRPHEMDRKQKAGMHKAEEVRREGEYERGANDDAEAEGEGEGEGVFEMEEDVAELPGKGRSANANANANGDNTESAGEKGADATGTSPSDSTASLDSNANAKARPAQPGRRMSNVSTEEIAQARSYREGVMASGGESLGCSLYFLQCRLRARGRCICCGSTESRITSTQ